MSNIFYYISLIFYIVSIVFYQIHTFRRYYFFSFWAPLFLWIGFFSHTLGLLQVFMHYGMIGVVGLYQNLNIFSWGLVFALLIVNVGYKVRFLNFFVTPLSAFIIFVFLMRGKVLESSPCLFNDFWIVLHILFIFIAYGFLTLAFLTGFLYLLQDCLIRAKLLGKLFRELPSLSRLSFLNRRILSFGFLFLTIGLVIGIVYIRICFNTWWNWDLKEVFSYITWVLYAILVQIHFMLGWRGRKSAWLSVFAFMVLLFTFIGIRFCCSGYHFFDDLFKMESNLL